MKRTTFRIIILILPLFFLFSIPSAAQEWQTSSEIARDGTFIAYGNGVVKDRKTGLEWVAGPDMDMTWNEAKSWVNNLNIAGGGWRMPKIAELKTLYQKGTGTRNMTTLLKTTGWWVWSGETKVSSSAWGFSFNLGYECWGLRDLSGVRAFAVRSGKKEKLEMAKLPSTPSLKEIPRDGLFLAYDNGTVLDTKTGLMWAAKDNGRNINWLDAKKYCENYRGGGYSDWRMPTVDELASLYDENKSYQAKPNSYIVHLTELIQLTTRCPWASETRGSWAAYFHFLLGYRSWVLQSYSGNYRALPVRSGN